MQSVLPARSSGRALCAAQSRPACAGSVLRRTARPVRVTQCSASTDAEQLQAQVVKAAALTSAVGTFLAAGNVSAAQEIADIAAQSDGRFGILATLSLPALAWVGFNIFGPALNQLQNMQNKTGAARSMAGLGVGMALLLAAQQASASSEVAELAAGDNRLGIIAVVLLPVLGWVLFNILGPAKNQLDNMTGNQPGRGRRRGIAGAVGLSAASLLATQQADASSEVAQLAAGDGRLGIIAVVLLPVIGWVLFNILGPAKNQLDNMTGGGGGRRRGVAGAVGLTAAGLLASQQADAASEVAQLAAGDGRLGIITVVLLPVIGWVLFNILGPAKNQLDNMTGGGGGRRR